MTKKRFVLIVKVFAVSVLLFMIGFLFNSTILNPPKVFGAEGGGGDWGDAFKNDKGKIICICDAKETDCKPCLTIQVPEQ